VFQKNVLFSSSGPPHGVVTQQPKYTPPSKPQKSWPHKNRDLHIKSIIKTRKSRWAFSAVELYSFGTGCVPTDVVS
jgi:hypothetical protein